MDKYPNFEKLLASETEFQIDFKDRNSAVIIIAPHGGNIEPHTSDIAKLMAGKKYSYFCFNGMKPFNNWDLHITSHNFDEQHSLELIDKSQTVITVHGCTMRKARIYLGGLDHELKQKIAQQLVNQKLPFKISTPLSRNSGSSPANICNRGLTGKGVQLEISRPLRDSPAAWTKIADAVQAALEQSSSPDRRVIQPPSFHILS